MNNNCSLTIHPAVNSGTMGRDHYNIRALLCAYDPGSFCFHIYFFERRDQMENVQPLNTVGGEDLLQMHLPPQQFIVEGLLPVGLVMIVGATKTGKSFLTLQLCLAVSQGEPLWNYPTKKGHVLYLALEDPWTRLQKRVLSMKGTASNCLQLSIDSETINKGLIEQIDDEEITVWPSDSKEDTPETLRKDIYAIEPATTEATVTAALRSLMAFCKASPDKRDLLLGQRAPRQDVSQQLSCSYHPAYDDILLRAKQARDYFLLQGPPGTGKTSMALRFLVEEEFSILNSQFSILLTAYTHRAVDEICAMLEESGQDYLRLGNEATCDPRFAHRLLSSAFCEKPRLDDIRQRLERVPIVVSTTLTLLTRPYLFNMKHFSLCIVDEASQILEPYIIGLLSSDSIDRFILIGDHKQLPAVVAQPDDEPRLHDCRQSLFERLLRQERETGRTVFTGILQYQGRMHPDIAAFPNEWFYRRERLQPVPCPHQLEERLDYHEPSADALDDQLKQHRVLFLPVDDEAFMVADLLRRLYRQIGSEHFDHSRSIGVIVTYRYQITLIRREIAKLNIPQLLDISIDTVERYQGSQRDVIIYSLGVQDAEQLAFLTSNSFEEGGHVIDRKLNVAMTRARKQLLMTGNMDILRQNAIFSELICRYCI